MDGKWPDYNRRLRNVLASLTDEQLLLRPTPQRWPLWATIGHLACQRVFWLRDFTSEPGADTTPFTDAGHDCPGDDDLDNVLSSAQLVSALDSTFRIIEARLDSWTIDMLKEVIERQDYGPDWVHTRASVIQRVFSHDVWHIAELNDTLGRSGLPQVNLWE